MIDFWLKIAGVVVAATVLGGAATTIRHEVALSRVEQDISYMKKSQERIEYKLDNLLGD